MSPQPREIANWRNHPRIHAGAEGDNDMQIGIVTLPYIEYLRPLVIKKRLESVRW